MISKLTIFIIVVLCSVCVAKKHNSIKINHKPILAITTFSQPAENIGIKAPIVFISLNIRSSFFNTHVNLVKNDLLFFKNEASIGNSLIGSYENIGFMTISNIQDGLIVAREHDHILLLRNQSPSMSSAGIGFTMFGIMTITSAHAPKFMRFLFDNKIHVGPALFDGSGMGVGIGCRF